MAERQGKYLVLIAMIFAVAMMFVDRTIVSIAVPRINRDLHLTATGAQWIINGCLLALASLFAPHERGKALAILGTIFINKTSGVADATKTVYFVMAGVMAACLGVSVVALQRGQPEQVTADATAAAS